MVLIRDREIIKTEKLLIHAHPHPNKIGLKKGSKKRKIPDPTLME